MKGLGARLWSGYKFNTAFWLKFCEICSLGFWTLQVVWKQEICITFLSIFTYYSCLHRAKLCPNKNSTRMIRRSRFPFPLSILITAPYQYPIPNTQFRPLITSSHHVLRASKLYKTCHSIPPLIPNPHNLLSGQNSQQHQHGLPPKS